jgi:phosphatidylserine/phosphatidylglycerophosphate/cardiolipin synthase-like enzyme
LANGAANSKTVDKNKRGRGLVKKSKVNLHNRLVGSGHLAHNKFMVICDKNNKPLQVWTGSTNWTPNGMFGQVNKGIFIDDATLAVEYYNEWQQLLAAGGDYPASLAKYNATVKTGDLASTWFNPTLALADLAQASALMDAAEQGILFLMFNPGTKGTLYNKILDLSAAKPDLYIRGILNQDPGGKTGPLVSIKKPIRLLDKGKEITTDWQTILPDALKGKAGWDDESSIGLVRIHSKVIVIDPFGKTPYVITGSNNMGPKASGKNDDNLNIIQDKKLAEEYAVNIMSIYNHYHFRFSSTVNTKTQYKGLTKDPAWMQSYLTADRKTELDFWI